MLRTVFMIGLFALVGMFLLGTIFSIFGTIVGFVLSTVVKVLIVGAIVYLVIRVVSPETARRLRERFSGPSL